LHDANGSLNKQSVELIILSRRNAKTKFLKTYSHYLSLIKWFRNQYNMMLILIRNNLWFKYKNMLIYGGLIYRLRYVEKCYISEHKVRITWFFTGNNDIVIKRFKISMVFIFIIQTL
jgi:hypothetical protein